MSVDKTKSQIMARFFDGEDLDAIAKEFTDALNAAKAELESKTKSEKVKKDAMLDVLSALYEYLRVAGYEDLAEGLVENKDSLADKLIENVDSLVALFKATDIFLF